MHLQLAWRNIWRNPRRTIVILVAVIIGVWSMVLETALMRGIAVGMIKNGIATLTGHLQIHQIGYRNDPAIENSIADPNPALRVLKDTLPPGSKWTPRIRVNAIASNARHSRGVTLVGIDPERESAISFIGHALSSGRYLTQTDVRGILVGEALMDKFDTKIGRKLVLMSQNTQRDIASKAYRIVGTFRAEMESTEKQYVFVTQTSAQQMLGLGGGISEIAVLLPEDANQDTVLRKIKNALPANQFESHGWQELLPFLISYLKLMDGFIYIWHIVVFIAMGFGIVNTTLMAVFERMREFGLLKALGMRPGWIVRGVLTESLVLLTIGVIIGNALAFITICPLSRSGIDLSALAAGVEYVGMTRIIYPVIMGQDLLVANLVVVVLGLAVSLYPAIKAARFKPVEALSYT
jgi:ABC-type lipoprotein release transport system permease subunit